MGERKKLEERGAKTKANKLSVEIQEGGGGNSTIYQFTLFCHRFGRKNEPRRDATHALGKKVSKFCRKQLENTLVFRAFFLPPPSANNYHHQSLLPLSPLFSPCFPTKCEVIAFRPLSTHLLRREKVGLMRLGWDEPGIYFPQLFLLLLT